MTEFYCTLKSALLKRQGSNDEMQVSVVNCRLGCCSLCLCFSNTLQLKPSFHQCIPNLNLLRIPKCTGS